MLMIYDSVPIDNLTQQIQVDVKQEMQGCIALEKKQGPYV